MNGGDFVLLALLLSAHCIGDFSPLSTTAVRAAKNGDGPVGWIWFHAGVHALLVLGGLALVRTPWAPALAAAAFELVTHFGVDYSRMAIGRRYPVIQDATRNPFWYALGVDQLAHGLVLAAIAVFVR